MTGIWTSSLHTQDLLVFTSAFAICAIAAVCLALFALRRTHKATRPARKAASVHGQRLAALHENIKQINADRERALALIATMGS